MNEERKEEGSQVCSVSSQPLQRAFQNRSCGWSWLAQGSHPRLRSRLLSITHGDFSLWQEWKERPGGGGQVTLRSFFFQQLYAFFHPVSCLQYTSSPTALHCGLWPSQPIPQSSLLWRRHRAEWAEGWSSTWGLEVMNSRVSFQGLQLETSLPCERHKVD